MTIRAKLQISAIVLTGCAAAIGVILLTLSEVVNTAIYKATTTNRLAQEIWALNALTNDYVFHQGERAQIQWQSQYASITALLTQQHVIFTTPQERTIVEAARQDHTSIKDIFARLVALRGALQQPGIEQGPTVALSIELEERLASQILVRSQSMIGAATQLSESSLTARARAHRQANVLTLALIVTLILVTAGTVLPLYRHLGTTMAKLLEGTDVIARGNLDYRVEIESTDEIGQVGRAFNTMAARLKASYESLEDKIRDRTTELALANAELQRKIAERKQAEEALQRTAAELARSNAELEQFAYVASHDLQEPLRTVAGFTQLLAKRYTGQLDAKADEYIAFAVDGATRMHQLITDLLEYSRVGTRGEPFQPTDCTAVLQQALTSLALTIQESRARVTHNPLPTLSGAAGQLTRLLQNLIGNALKYRSERPPQVHITAQPQGHAWLFAVQDNGIGFDPHHAERIFGVFQRLHTREKYPGTGIGLAICRKIVERHGGCIWAEGRPGEGATFYFTIPMEESARHEQPHPECTAD